MSGPVPYIPRNIAREVDDALQDADGWKYFESQILPAVVADSFRPADQVMIELARFSETVVGHQVVAWLRTVSDQAPYPAGGASIEETALAAARHQGRAHVGHVIEKAIREGRRLLDIKLKEQNP